MRLSWKLGRVAGINLFLHPSALILWFLVARNMGADLVQALPFVLAIFGSITLHEYGHALTARRYGIGTHDITLSMIGGIARLNRMPRSAGPELLITLAGPAVNFAIATIIAIALGVGRFSESIADPLFWLFSLNLGLGLFNLLPVFPMDGGRVLRALLSGWLGRVKATEIAASIGQFLAIVGGVLAVFSGQWMLAILAIFIYGAAVSERSRVEGEARDRGHLEGLTDPPAAPAGYQWITRGDGVWRLAPVIRRAPRWGSQS